MVRKISRELRIAARYRRVRPYDTGFRHFPLVSSAGQIQGGKCVLYVFWTSGFGLLVVVVLPQQTRARICRVPGASMPRRH